MNIQKPSFESEHGASEEALFKPTMPSAVLGAEIGGRALLDVYISFLESNLNEVMEISLSEHTITGSEIRERIEERQRLSMDKLLVRVFDPQRTEILKETGCDRDATSELSRGGQIWEKVAMKSNGLAEGQVDQVFYAVDIHPKTVYSVANDRSLAIYYAPATKVIKPSAPIKDSMGNGYFHMFISPDIKKQSLVGVISYNG